MSRPVFGDAPPNWKTGYQARHAHALARGLHPLTMRPLRTDGTRCKTCRHVVRVHMGNVYRKCALGAHTGGSATDLKVTWPACELYQEAANEDEQQDVFPPK